MMAVLKIDLHGTEDVPASVHEGKFTPGKYGEWRFDKRSYSTIPPPRHLNKPPPGIENELVSVLFLRFSVASIGPS